MDEQAEQTFQKVMAAPLLASQRLGKPVWVFWGLDEDRYVFIRADINQDSKLPRVLTQLKRNAASIPTVDQLRSTDFIAALPRRDYELRMRYPPLFQAIYSPIGLPEDLEPGATHTRAGWLIDSADRRLWYAQL
jgi:hypothetical protein